MTKDISGEAFPGRPNRDRIISTLAAKISSGDLPLHSRLPPERVLCGELGVGRAVLRAALRELEAEGLIWRHVGKGTFVGARPSSTLSTTILADRRGTLHELLEMRQLLEPIAARLAAQRAQPPDLALLARYQMLAAQAEGWPEYLKWDEMFHRVIVEISANTYLISMMDCLIKTRRNARWSNVDQVKFAKSLQASFSDQHSEIYERINAGDSAGAERAMTSHMGLISAELGPMIAGGGR